MKSAVAALNLGQDILTRLDAIAAAERRSRSNQARIFLEAAIAADAALRRKAADQFAKTQTPGSFDPRSAAGSLPDSSAGRLQVERPAVSRSELCPGAAVDGDPSRDGKPPAAPFFSRNES